MAAQMELQIDIPGLRTLWGRNDFKDLKLSVMDKWFEVFPEELICERNSQYHYYHVRQPGKKESRITFMGLKDLGGLGSQEFGLIIVTEAHETSLQAYRTLKRRCRQRGVPCMILMESEAPNSSHWLNDLTNPENSDYDKDVEVWELSTYENWANLPEAYRGSLESMPEAAKRKYILGKSGFSVAGKPFYNGYNHSVHAGRFKHIPRKPIDVGWDFGFHFPAVVITQDDDKDRWVWLRERLGRDTTIKKFGSEIVTMLADEFPDCDQRHYGDPAGNQVSDKSEKADDTSIKILRDLGIYVQTKPSTYRARKEIMERKLCTYNDGRPQVLIDTEGCPIACDGFMGGYRYPTKREATEYSDGQLEVPFRDGFYEHVMNAGEYIMVNRFKAVERKFARARHPRGAI